MSFWQAADTTAKTPLPDFGAYGFPINRCHACPRAAIYALSDLTMIRVGEALRYACTGHLPDESQRVPPSPVQMTAAELFQRRRREEREYLARLIEESPDAAETIAAARRLNEALPPTRRETTPTTLPPLTDGNKDSFVTRFFESMKGRMRS